ncbi:hypothetical protein AQUCO_01300289v1 [Aquilegia coerulea]|uniref:DUF7733 domain-containing protein n=1 Tax=Aquilegia coerulea TaxID=218851 RepID=A0A2G5E0U9_AQUCA|nr:hypothetical protein AQUCO_01300289v1 [Aquilegia coerulea]
MSGGVGPTGSDIKLARQEEEQEMKQLNSSMNKTKSSNIHKSSILNFRQLNTLAVVVVLSASGMVGMEDVGFVLFSVLYVFFLSKIAFPSLPTSIDESPIFGEKNRMLGIYVSVAALIGLFLPIIYIFHGIIEGDKQGIKAAAPHVFLLASQVFMEGLTFSGRFSIPIRVFVPVFYNTKRIFTIVDWMRDEIGKVDVEDSGSDMRLHVGRGLAVANMAFWCFNLFGFLLPVYLPKAFKRYYGGYKVKE